MRYISLTSEEEKELGEQMKNSSHLKERRPSHCLLLSHASKTVNTLADIFRVKRLSNTRCLDKWQVGNKGTILQQSGRKKRLAHIDKEQLAQYVEDQSQNLNGLVIL